MLLNFSVSNWLSFKGKVNFSTIATGLDTHCKRLSVLSNAHIKALPIALMFGGNASGKSNFVNALAFARRFVIGAKEPDEEIAVKPYLLSPEIAKRKTRFGFLLLAKDIVYEFSFSVDRKRVVDEKLSILRKESVEWLYSRSSKGIEINEKFIGGNGEENLEFFRYLKQGTLPNQLFLTNSVFQNFDHFRPVFNWFRSLSVITHSTGFRKFPYFFEMEDSIATVLNRVIRNFDLGFSLSIGDEVQIEHMFLPEELLSEIKKGD